MYVPNGPRRRTLKLELRRLARAEVLATIIGHNGRALRHVDPDTPLAWVCWRLFAARRIANALNGDLMLTNRLERVRGQVKTPRVRVNRHSFGVHVARRDVLQACLRSRVNRRPSQYKIRTNLEIEHRRLSHEIRYAK